MANTLAPRGLINPKLITGGEPRHTTFLVGATYASDFLPGQLLQRRSDGRVIHLSATNYRSVAGVVTSYLKNPNSKSSPSGVDLEVQGVNDLINTEWELQLSCANTNAQLLVGENVGIFATAYLNLAHAAATAADGVTRPYAPYIVGSLPTTAARMFRVIGVVVDQKNDPAANNPRMKVKFNPMFIEGFGTVTAEEEGV